MKQVSDGIKQGNTEKGGGLVIDSIKVFFIKQGWGSRQRKVGWEKVS